MTEWLLILPILDRLYTSVIPLNPENRLLKVSWSTDLSPTALLGTADPCTEMYTCGGVGGGVYPGWGYGRVAGRAIPVPHPQPSQDPYFIIFSLKALPTAK